MGASDWFRALQVPVLPVSVGPAVVGSLLGAQAAGRLDVGLMGLVLLSLLLIQVAANLQKGLVESADLRDEPARPRSPFVFDAGAIGRTGVDRDKLRAVTLSLFGAGVAVGLVVVAIKGDVVLLFLGGLGAAFAYAYSAPPLKLSYRGIGEVATFVAFGPLMVWGAFRAQDIPPYLPPYVPLALERLGPAVLPGIAFGLLAALVSFARYFPPQAEDRAKGKLTPVVRFGASRSSAAVLALAASSALALYVWATVYRSPCVYYMMTWIRDPGPDYVILGSAFLAASLGALSFAMLRSSDPLKVERGVAPAVAAHLFVSSVLGAQLLYGSRCLIF